MPNKKITFDLPKRLEWHVKEIQNFKMIQSLVSPVVTVYKTGYRYSKNNNFITQKAMWLACACFN